MDEGPRPRTDLGHRTWAGPRTKVQEPRASAVALYNMFSFGGSSMRKSIVRSFVVAFTVALAVSWSATAVAQWLKYPTPGVPKTANGKPNLTAPTPRTADGKPDFSGIWLTDSPCAQSQDPESLTCGSELPMGRAGGL